MFETPLTIVGTVVSDVERRRIEPSGATVVHFRVASTSRRWDKEKGRWVDGESLYLKVSCWRSLGQNVFQSVFKGDPVIVTGRVYSRTYEHQGTMRWSYEMDAFAVGHDLSRGTAMFRRHRQTGATEAPQASSEDQSSVDKTAVEQVATEEKEQNRNARLAPEAPDQAEEPADPESYVTENDLDEPDLDSDLDEESDSPVVTGLSGLTAREAVAV